MAQSTSRIRRTARGLVNPSNSSSCNQISDPFPLGPLDSLVNPIIPIAVVFLYPAPIPQSDPVISLGSLRRALELVLDSYPHLTGRILVDPAGRSPSIHRLRSGAEMVTAECDASLDCLAPSNQTTLALHDFPQGGNEFLPVYDATDSTIHDQAILSIQHTSFTCGAAALGIRILHCVCDAEGYLLFVRDLAEVYRRAKAGMASGVDRGLLNPPHIVPFIGYSDQNDNSTDQAESSSKLYHLQEDGPSTHLDAPQDGSIGLLTVSGRFIRFSGAELRSIKQAAIPPDGEGWISTFDALAAHLYHHVNRARIALRQSETSIPPLTPFDFLTPVNLRPRFGPQAFPPNYTGNALITAVTEVPQDILAAGPLWRIAKTVHEVTRTEALTLTEELEGTIRWIAVQPDKRKIVQDFRFGTGHFMLSQWNRFDLYSGADFGAKPLLIAPPFTSISLIDGLGYLLPTSGQDEQEIEVCLALDDRVWKFLDQDDGLRSYRCVA